MPKEKRRALDAKAKKEYFIGYAKETKEYRVQYPDDNKIAIARDVVFTGKLDRVIMQEKWDDDDLQVSEKKNPSKDEDSENDIEPIENNEELQFEPQARDAPELNGPNAEAEPENAAEGVNGENEEMQIQGKGYQFQSSRADLGNEWELTIKKRIARSSVRFNSSYSRLNSFLRAHADQTV